MNSYYLLVVFFVNTALSYEVPIVKTAQGLVRGIKSDDEDYFMFLGIPYGFVNPLNPFGPSSPHPAFEDTFTADDDSAACPQQDPTPFGTLNCLHLNIFVPTNSTKLYPVLVYIHGGEFLKGSKGKSSYNPKYLVRYGIVVVTLNYRLGPFGFMCTDHERVPGNQGLRDQLLALEWVKENIGHFGGNASQVTLSGHSAGGISADLHIVSGRTGYFQQAILQSGVAFIPNYPATERNAPRILSEYLGYNTSNLVDALDFLAKVDPLEIVAASTKIGLQFRPCIVKKFEGVEGFLTENWVKKEIILEAKDLNIIIGFNDNEALGLFVNEDTNLSNIVNESLSEAFISNQGFVGYDQVKHFFGGENQTLKEAVSLRSDLSFIYNAIRAARRYMKSEVKNLYLYRFSYDEGRNLYKRHVNTSLKGAIHGDELGFLFASDDFGIPTEKDRIMIDRMTEMWTNFVKFGDPTPQATSSLTKWPNATATLRHLHIDNEASACPVLYQHRVPFWDLMFILNRDLLTSPVDA